METARQVIVKSGATDCQRSRVEKAVEVLNGEVNGACSAADRGGDNSARNTAEREVGVVSATSVGILSSGTTMTGTDPMVRRRTRTATASPAARVGSTGVVKARLARVSHCVFCMCWTNVRKGTDARTDILRGTKSRPFA